MRLRLSMLLAAMAGAAGSLLLAGDLYRRVTAAQRHMAENAAYSGADTVFGMTHVLGMAAMGVLFLAIFLLIIAENKHSAAQEELEESHVTATHTPAPVSAVVKPLAQVSAASGVALVARTPEVPHPLPKPPPAPTVPPPPPPPKPGSVAARNFYVVEASPAPKPVPGTEADEIGTPVPITETEFQRAVVYEQVLREQGEVPVGTPVSGETGTNMDAVIDERADSKPNTKPPAQH